MGNTAASRELVKTWKVQVTSKGVALTINGQAFEIPEATAHSMVFDMQRATTGYTVPERDSTAE